MRTLVTGATGLIGRSLIGRLGPGAMVLSRDPDRARRRLGAVEAHRWEPEVGQPPAAALDGVEVVFNLSGEPIADARWTAERKRHLRDSRIMGTRHLVARLAALPTSRRPGVLVSASAVGYYGDRGDEELDEGSSGGRGFLAELCADWEREALAAEALGIRVVCLRTGVVLAPGGGALARMLTPFRLGVGGRLGNGRQWMPWIALDDVVGLLLHAGSNASVRGPLNAVGPRPVTNAEFTRVLGQALHRPALLPLPRTALRLVFGELSQVLTDSQRVFPRVAERTGYGFVHPELGAALRAALSGR